MSNGESGARGFSAGWIVTVVLSGVLLLAVAAAIIGFVLKSEDAATVETLVQTSGPVSLAEAKIGCPIPLPPEAKNIQYKRWYCRVAMDEYVRFEAPPEVCVAHAGAVFAGLRKNRSLPAATHPLTTITITAPARNPVGPAEGKEPTCPPWFRPEGIERGVASVNGGSHTPDIWIDLDRGILYYHMTD